MLSRGLSVNSDSMRHNFFIMSFCKGIKIATFFVDNELRGYDVQDLLYRQRDGA